MAFKIPGYDATERTRLSLIIPGAGGGAPRKIVSAPSDSWHELESQLEALQLAYIHERNRSGEGASTFFDGQVADEAGQVVARVSYNGRLWGADIWTPAREPLREAPALPGQDWTNAGDKNPREGTLLYKLGEASLDLNDDEFTVPVVSVTPEKDSGGSDKAFLLREGTLFLAERDFKPALQTIGARLTTQGGDKAIVISVPDGKPVSVPLDSPEGHRVMADAAHAYCGISNVEISVVVSIGLPDHLDQPRKFLGHDTTYYRAGSSLWAVMRSELDGFDTIFPGERNPFQAEVIPAELLEGMPDEVRTRADLLEIAAFRNLDTDTSGNPVVWRNHYAHEDCESPEVPGETPSWVDAWSCQVDDDCYCCGISISPERSEWIGPEDPELRELWEDLPEKDDAPSMSLGM